MTANLGSGDTGFYINGRWFNQHLHGMVDEVRLWDIARSQEEIQASMNVSLTGSETGLAGYWPLNETTEVNGNSPVTVDLTANHNDLWVVYGSQIVDIPAGSEVAIAPYFVIESLEGIVNNGFSFTPFVSGWPSPDIAFVSGPTGMTFDDLSGTINWTPAAGQVGDNDFIFEATNSSGTVQGTYTISVRGPASAFINGPGIDSRIRVTHGGSVNPSANPGAYQITGSNITIEAWVYPLDFPDPQFGTHIAGLPIWPSGDPFDIYSLWAYHGENGEEYPRPAFVISSGEPGSRNVAVSPDTFKTFQWTHLAGTYNGQFLNLYVNGELKSQVATTIEIGGESVGFYIGRFLSNRFFGLIDDVRLWNITRSETDIQNNMDIGLTGNEPGLVGYWKLDDGADVDGVWVAVDETSNHNDLVIQGPTTFVPFHPFAEYGTPSISDYPPSINFG
ncbi:MAG: hypothetical protein KAK01_00035, partial [Candidatus Marinimicrobia bacterium]|nr:hypothetical protein [Candidatus Neomarinimicrobiota bacterium]